MVASDGTVFKRASNNEECCLKSSISTSENGAQYGWPFLPGCMGSGKRTFQEWINDAALYRDTSGICVDGWRYLKKGILIKSNKFQNMQINAVD